jgi:hypothetical protein
MKRVKNRSQPAILPRRGRAATPQNPRTTEKFTWPDFQPGNGLGRSAVA